MPSGSGITAPQELKTNALVAVGAAAFVAWAPVAGVPDAGARIAAQIVSGIGFLGAGVILREGLNVRGLNTAATLWCSAAVGINAGTGELVLASFVTLLILAINLGLQPFIALINRLPRRDSMLDCVYGVSVQCDSAAEDEVRTFLVKGDGKTRMTVNGVNATRLADTGQTEIVLHYRLHKRNDAMIERLIGALARRKDVTATRWTMEAMSE